MCEISYEYLEWNGLSVCRDTDTSIALNLNDMSVERKRLKLHAYFRREIWVILHKYWVSFILIFFLREQSTVLAPMGGTPFCPSPSFFTPCLISRVKNSVREKQWSLYRCVRARHSPDKLLLLPSPHSLLKKPKRRCVPRAGYGVSQQAAVVWAGVTGTRALPFSPGMGRTAGTGQREEKLCWPS